MNKDIFKVTSPESIDISGFPENKCRHSEALAEESQACHCATKTKTSCHCEEVALQPTWQSKENKFWIASHSFAMTRNVSMHSLWQKLSLFLLS